MSLFNANQILKQLPLFLEPDFRKVLGANNASGLNGLEDQVVSVGADTYTLLMTIGFTVGLLSLIAVAVSRFIFSGGSGDKEKGKEAITRIALVIFAMCFVVVIFGIIKKVGALF